MYQFSLSTYSVTWDDSTTPATPHWSEVSANSGNGCPQGSTLSLDPILFTDHATGRTFESQLTGVDSFTCYTDDDGKTWQPSTGGGIPAAWTTRRSAAAPSRPTGSARCRPRPTRTPSTTAARTSRPRSAPLSRDGGTTFGAGVPTYSLLDCDGLHGHVKVAPDGTAYLPNKSCNGNQAVVTSTDNGTTWTVNPVPGTTPSDSDPSVGTGANGTLYFGYVDGSGVPGVAVSTDQGKTWTDRQSVGTEFGIKNAVFPTMVAGDDDRAAFAYLGTPTGGNYQDEANFHGEWHLYIDTTYDGGKTWVTSDATPNDPVQVGSICTGGTTCGNDRNLLDFIDVTTDDHGRVEVAFADGCINACVTDPQHNGRDAYATIARQAGGQPLFSAYDPVTTNVQLSSLQVTKQSDGRFTALVGLKNTGTQPLSGLQTQAARRPQAGGPDAGGRPGRGPDADRVGLVEAQRRQVAHHHRRGGPVERARRGRRGGQQGRHDDPAVGRRPPRPRQGRGRGGDPTSGVPAHDNAVDPTRRVRRIHRVVCRDQSARDTSGVPCGRRTCSWTPLR